MCSSSSAETGRSDVVPRYVVRVLAGWFVLLAKMYGGAAMAKPGWLPCGTNVNVDASSTLSSNPDSATVS